MHTNKSSICIGLDTGSTTVKIAVVCPDTYQLLYSEYKRHHTEQALTAYRMLKSAAAKFPGKKIRISVCGSGGSTIAGLINAFFIQEVAANTIYIQRFYKETGTAIELGGQDAKIIFFENDKNTDDLKVTDMRMNGVCAGGTGAFIDQVSELLGIPVSEFNTLAEKSKNVYDIPGRCGVFAITDIQTLINQGVSKEDIALSSFYAVVNQTIAGLAWGKDFHSKVVFEGGPLTFNPVLRRVFMENLNLKEKDIIIPEHPELSAAFGASIACNTVFAHKEQNFYIDKALKNLEKYLESGDPEKNTSLKPFFINDNEKQEFSKRHTRSSINTPVIKTNKQEFYIGIDAGSTTSKFVFLDKNNRVIDSFYDRNHGDPLGVIKNALIKKLNKMKSSGISYRILGAGTTGYGGELFAKAFTADYYNVETIAHVESAKRYLPDVSFILDIGGQDVKAIFVKNKIITKIILNEACSSGCGAFLENYAKSIGILPGEISKLAFNSANPSSLGSRCTIFINSSITTELKNGKKTEDILAGLCYSLIENIFTKIIRVNDYSLLGENIILQGGVSKNDAVIRAFEIFTQKKPVRPDLPGLMGAIGIAMLTAKHMEEQDRSYSTFLDEKKLNDFEYKRKQGVICTKCENKCKLDIISFNTGKQFITGNKCENGSKIAAGAQTGKSESIHSCTSKTDMITLYNKLLYKDFKYNRDTKKTGKTIGLPSVLELRESMPFWRSFFKSLGYEVISSGKSNYKMYESGIKTIPSDTVCLPAKISHGHILDLVNKKADIIFFPMMIVRPYTNKTAQGGWMCPVIQGYPEVIAKNMDLKKKYNIDFIYPFFHWLNIKLRNKQITEHFKSWGHSHQEIKTAIKNADESVLLFREKLAEEGSKILKKIKNTNRFAVIVACRVYQYDSFINHNIADIFKKLDIPILILNGIPDLNKTNILDSRTDNHIDFHYRMIEAAYFASDNLEIEMMQIISFGCGHDAILGDEITRILNNAGKELLQVKLDEGNIQGQLNLRIKSFIETIKLKRKAAQNEKTGKIRDNYKDENISGKVRFIKKHKKEKTILAPNLSRAFSYAASKILQKQGFNFVSVPLADNRAFTLGKKYVHNDICFPAQVNIGEIFREIERGNYDMNNLTIALSKNCDYCRSGQYHVLARKILDDMGYTQVPVVTTGRDWKNLHPGFRINLAFQERMLWAMTIMDYMEHIRRTIRAYEAVKGKADELFEYWMIRIVDDLLINNKNALNSFEKAVADYNNMELKTGKRYPKVCVVGEILVQYNPAANRYIEKYLEENGLEVYIPSMVDFFRRDHLIREDMARRHMLPNPWIYGLLSDVQDFMYTMVQQKVLKIYNNFKYAEAKHDVHDLLNKLDGFMDKSYFAGEGWLIPGTIMEMAENGINSFIVIQPFSCMSNHISGRGVFKALKEMYPGINLLALDFDPDTSMANVENRLQMLIYSTLRFF